MFNAIDTDFDFSAADRLCDSLEELDGFSAVYYLCDCLEEELDDFLWVEPEVMDFLATDRPLNFTWTELDFSETYCLFDNIEAETDDLLAAECDEGILVADCLLNSIGTELIYYLFIIYFILKVQVMNRLNERIDHN